MVLQASGVLGLDRGVERWRGFGLDLWELENSTSEVALQLPCRLMTEALSNDLAKPHHHNNPFACRKLLSDGHHEVQGTT